MKDDERQAHITPIVSTDFMQALFNIHTPTSPLGDYFKIPANQTGCQS